MTNQFLIRLWALCGQELGHSYPQYLLNSEQSIKVLREWTQTSKNLVLQMYGCSFKEVFKLPEVLKKIICFSIKYPHVAWLCFYILECWKLSHAEQCLHLVDVQILTDPVNTTRIF